MPVSVMQAVRARNAARAAARAGAAPVLEAEPPLMRFVDSAFATRVEYELWTAEMRGGGR
eukprot:scaffold11258_cov82-Isochrysis_galbana.AAC.2